MSDKAIFDIARSCLELFRSYLSENRPSSVRIETEQQRFWAWSNTLKVFAKPHICLDAQLHADKYAQIRRMVLLLLGVLRQNLSLALESVLIPRTGHENSSDLARSAAQQDGSPLEVALFGIEGSLKRLEKIATVILQATQGSLARRVSAYAEKRRAQEFEEGVEDCIEDHIAGVIRFRFQGAISSSLSQLLVDTCLHRYYRILYERSRRDQELPRLQLPALLIKPPFQSEGQGTPVVRQLQQPEHKTQSEHRTLPLTIDENVVQEKLAEESSAQPQPQNPPSVSEAGAALYPSPPDIADGQTDGTCPLCLKVFPAEEFEGRQWKIHVDKDVQPFVCISVDCSKNFRFFDNRKSWIDHMRKTHTSLWIRYLHNTVLWKCAPCGSKKAGYYGSERELLDHMSKSHRDIEESERRNTASSSSIPQPRPVDICPICGDSHLPHRHSAGEDSTDFEDRMPPQQLKKMSGHIKKARVQFAISTDHSEDSKADPDLGRNSSVQLSKEIKNHDRIERWIGRHLKALAFYFSNRLIADQEGELNSSQERSADATSTEFESPPTLAHDDALPKFEHDEDPPKLPTLRHEGPYVQDEIDLIERNRHELVEMWDWDDTGRVAEPGLTSDELERFFPDTREPLQNRLIDALQETLRHPEKSAAGGENIGTPVLEQEGQHPTSEHPCDCCGKCKPNEAYCNVCQSTFCPECWATQISHKNHHLAPGNVPHEKTSHNVMMKIKKILEPELNDAMEEELHAEDENTTWFGIVREDGELPIFQDYGRYANLMSDTEPKGNLEHHGTRYPGLVSFVGQAGAGKSTLIKLLMYLSKDGAGSFASPIVRSVMNQHVPTSGDVHLYPDPNSISSVTPILYADCEGLEGGEREPISSRFKKNNHDFTSVGRQSSFEKKARRTQHTSEWEIIWADTPAKSSREFAVTHLYPRFLYTFSDVVVFVLKNPKTIEDAFEKLVAWAGAAIEESSNQPVLPHTIIVLNASENSTEPQIWDPQIATNKVLQSLSKTVFKNDNFKKYAAFWRKRQRQVDTVEKLLLSYYSSIRVVCIPTSGRPVLISEQVSKLYNCIQSACTASRLQKRSLGMLLDADQLQKYFQFALDHFAGNPDTMFDFVQPSLVNRLIPSDFGGNILELAIKMMDVWENVASGPILFTELSYMVASCIMLESARHGIKGAADQIFHEYVEHLDAALEKFCDHHWPCEFVKHGHDGGRCVNVRSGHSKGHQLKSGKVMGAGEYISGFSFAEHRKQFQYDVFFRLDQLLSRIRESQEVTQMPEDQAAAEIHFHTVMKYFYAHTIRDRPDAYISHTACFCCLFESPEHGLPCSHILCTRCLKAFGTSRKKGVIEIDRCPIDSEEFSQGVLNMTLKPETAGTRTTIAANSSHWAGRSRSDRNRNNWISLPSAHSSSESDLIASYSNPAYVLGNSSKASLQASASRTSRRGLADLEGSEHSDVAPIFQSKPSELYSHEVYELPG